MGINGLLSAAVNLITADILWQAANRNEERNSPRAHSAWSLVRGYSCFRGSARQFAHGVVQIAHTLSESLKSRVIVGYVRPMRRLFTVSLGALVGALAFVPAVVVAPAAQAGEIQHLKIISDPCGSASSQYLEFGTVVGDRDNTGKGAEKFRFEVHDGSGELTGSLTHLTTPGWSNDFGRVQVGFREAAVNPITATAVSAAGNGYDEQFLASAELYCANLPGSIVTTPAHLTYPDAADVSDTLVPFVEELAGSPVTYSVGTPPASGALAVNPDGTFTYQWGAASTVSFDVTVRNAAGQQQVLPVTLKRPMSAPIVLTPSATEVTFGDPVSIAARVAGGNTELLPTGTVTFSGEGDGESWVEDVGPDSVATLDFEELPVGIHTFSASYSGDSNYGASVSDAVTDTVTAKEEPGTGEPECAEGEALNEAGECVTTGTEVKAARAKTLAGERRRSRCQTLTRITLSLGRRSP